MKENKIVLQELLNQIDTYRMEYRDGQSHLVGRSKLTEDS